LRGEGRVADFCRQCAKEVDPSFPGDDLAGLCRPGEIITALCEGCGSTYVDSEGYCVGPCSIPGHSRQREWWTPREVSELFRVHITTVYRWIEIGKLPVLRLRRNVYRIKAADVRKLAGTGNGGQGEIPNRLS